MPQPRSPLDISLVALLAITEAEYQAQFSDTAITRAKRWMLQRNAAVALGNTGDESAIPPLARALTANPHPIVRGHAAWAIGEIACRSGKLSHVAPLREALVREEDESVRDEIRSAVARANTEV